MSKNQNQPEAKQENDGWKVMGLVAAFAVAVSGANILFLNAADKMQDADPMYVMTTAEKSVEDLGYGNVRFETFNKEADKPARVTFTAEKDFVAYKGFADCTARSCSRVNVSVAYRLPGA